MMKMEKNGTLEKAFTALHEAEIHYLETAEALISDGIKVKNGEFWLHCKYDRCIFESNSWVSKSEFLMEICPYIH